MRLETTAYQHNNKDIQLGIQFYFSTLVTTKWPVTIYPYLTRTLQIKQSWSICCVEKNCIFYRHCNVLTIPMDIYIWWLIDWWFLTPYQQHGPYSRWLMYRKVPLYFSIAAQGPAISKTMYDKTRPASLSREIKQTRQLDRYLSQAWLLYHWNKGTGFLAHPDGCTVTVQLYNNYCIISQY